MPTGHPVVALCPFLPLDRSYEFAGVWVGPIDEFDGHWELPELEQPARHLAHSFVDASGRHFDKPALIAVGGTVTGRDLPDIAALQLAINFGALVGNPRHPLPEQLPPSVITADNCDIWQQPIDLDEQWISVARGGRVPTIYAGTRSTDLGFHVAATPETGRPSPVSIDTEVANAVFEVCARPDRTSDAELARRVQQSIRWWIQSWRNSPSISWEDRIVHLRIAMDALAGSDKTCEVVTFLKELFQPLSQVTDSVLWSHDCPTVERTWGSGESATVSGFEGWLRAFAEVRNSIVHEGTASSHEYSAYNSPYNGDFLDVADRVVVEAILVALTRCGFDLLWLPPPSRSIWHTIYEELPERDNDGDQ